VLRRLGRFTGCMAGVALALAAATPAAAHVRWFIPDQQEFLPAWERVLSWPTLAVIIASGLLFLLLRLVERLAGSPHIPKVKLLAHMEPCATTILAVQTGISLIYFATQRNLFIPTLSLPPTIFGWLLVALQILIGFTLITGLGDRAGALLLAGVWMLGFMLFPAWAVLEQALYAGIGIALFVLGRTIPPPAIARRLLVLRGYEREAIAALRILTGFSIALVAFTEKLLVPEAGSAFLQRYPGFNVARVFLGWGWITDEQFTLLAGIVEATIGLLLMSGVLTRVVILGMWVPFNVTIPFLPPVELLGHLPILGIMYVLLLYGSGIQPHAVERRLVPALTGELAAQQRRLTGEEPSPAGRGPIE